MFRRTLLAVAALATAIPAAAADTGIGPAAVIDHVALSVADANVSAAFYMRAFGLAELPTKLPATRWLTLGNGVALHLIGGRTAPVAAPRAVHLALRTRDLGATTAWLDAQGIAWSDFLAHPRTIQTRFDGVRQIFIADPDGYWVEIADKP